MAAATPTPEEAAGAAVAAMAGGWRLDAKQSDSMEPLLEFMGVPWLVRKAIVAASGASSPPTMRVAATAGGMDVEAHGGAGPSRNSYAWGAGNKHVTPKGEFPATLAAGTAAGEVVLHVDAPKGRLTSRYTLDASGRLLLTIAGPGFAIKRVYNRMP